MQFADQIDQVLDAAAKAIQFPGGKSVAVTQHFQRLGPWHADRLCARLDALTKAGCQRIFEDKISGSRAERPGLAK
ncbi:hypothetical protein GCM10008020_23540 [Massilia psychrophila]|nr:hypothetical protein GCM10008020_23540 [Massilia psychrophila]